jgi:hypothetical protein
MKLLPFSFICLILITLSFNVFALDNTSKYSMKDLEVLEQQNNYEEFLKHARDIRPSLRKKQWTEMVHTMATGYVDFKLSKKIIDDQTFQYIENLVLWPSLRNDEFFIVKRSRYGLLYLTQCIDKKESKSQCLAALHTFWHSGKQTPDLAWSLSQLLKKANSKADLWMFTKIIIKSDVSEFYCQRPFVQYQIFDKLRESLKTDVKKKLTLSIIDKMMNKSCWKKLEPSFKDSLFSDEPLVRKVSYNLLDAKDAIDTTTSDLFLTFYILSGPIVGPLFNKAWNTVTALGQNYQRRNNLLLKLKSMDPLPGKIFAHPNLTKRKTILRLLSQNIPEYIDFYAKSCVKYLKGLGEYPTGNPTIECPQLFEVSKGTKWIEQTVQQNYSAIKRPN